METTNDTKYVFPFVVVRDKLCILHPHKSDMRCSLFVGFFFSNIHNRCKQLKLHETSEIHILHKAMKIPYHENIF